MKRTYKAYKRGALILSTWASAPVSQATEEAAYQERLNRGDFDSVDVSSDDPHDQQFTMHARASTQGHQK